MDRTLNPRNLSGEIQVPSSKSDAQRAILCAALAKGTSTLYGLGQSDDELNMLNCVQQLGARIEYIDDTTIELTGISEPIQSCRLHVGESGLALRLLTSVCATFNVKVELIGDGTLCDRSMEFFDDVFPSLGVEVASNFGKIPLTVCGPMKAGDVYLDNVISSQYISGLIIGLSTLKEDSFIHVKHPVSAAYIEMTIQTLKRFGVSIKSDENGYFIKGNQSFIASDYQIEADWSSASYWLLAAALGHDVQVSGLNLASKQADKAILDVLLDAGCQLTVESEMIRVTSIAEKCFFVNATSCPDLFPTLVVLASSIIGVSEIKGYSRLFHKESNRALALKTEFEKLGVHIELIDDSMFVHGTGVIHASPVHSHFDHRIAMSLAIASTIADSAMTLSNCDVVSKSYADFWVDFQMLTN
jgi:3-phosphoshikimate 1-carboxyvinyltransferase